MKQKILIAVMAVVCLFACAFGLSACIGDSVSNDNDSSNSGNLGNEGNNGGDNGNQAHTHDYSERVVAPTCTEQGYSVFTCDCGDGYTDNYVDELGHTEVIDSAIAPTCIKTGLTDGKHCSVCNVVLVEQQEVPLIEHDFVNGACTVCGKLKPTEGLEYTLSADGNYYICGGRGTATETKIVIASEYNGKPVKEIAMYAFYFCSELTSVTIPDSVTMIGMFAFDGCMDLKEVHISDLSAWCNIDFKLGDKNGGWVGREIYSSNPLYFAQNLYLNNELVTEIAIPDGVSYISDRAFIECSSLMSVTIPDSITSVGSFVFAGCSRLIIYNEATSKPSGWSADWNESLCPVIWNCNNNDKDENGYAYTVIGGIRYSLKDGIATVVQQSKNIVTANIPSTVSYNGSDYSVTLIGAGAFENCIGLTMVTISKSVTSIGDKAFYGCRVLTIYSEATSKPSGWSDLSCPVVLDCNNNDKDENGYAYAVIDGIRYSLKDGVANVIEQPSNIVEAIITSTVNYNGNDYNVTSIGRYAFYRCSGLKDINFNGTMAQWHAIAKGLFWNADTGEYTVHCIDGDIARSES